MKSNRFVFLLVALVASLWLIGCETKIARGVGKQFELTKNGITDTTSNIEEGIKNVCDEAPKVSDDADEVLRLVSSEDNTTFTVDGKKMGVAKQLKVCINSSGEHTVVAQPANCTAKVEKLKPPYDFPIYEFRYMLAECQIAAPPTPILAPTTLTPSAKPSKSSRKRY